MNCKILDKIYKDDKSKIKFLYKYFKKEINQWIKNRNINGICLYSYSKGKNKGCYCLKITDKNCICKEHNKNYRNFKNEIKLYSKIDVEYFPENPNIINNMLNYNVKNKPSCPSFYDIYPILKPDEIIKENSVKKKKIKKGISLKLPLKLLNYDNFIYKNKNEKMNFNNIIKMDDKKEPSVLLKQNLRIANDNLLINKLIDNKLEYNNGNNVLPIEFIKFKGYGLYKMNNKIINTKIKHIYLYNRINSRILNNIIKLI